MSTHKLEWDHREEGKLWWFMEMYGKEAVYNAMVLHNFTGIEQESDKNDMKLIKWSYRKEDWTRVIENFS